MNGLLVCVVLMLLSVTPAAAAPAGALADVQGLGKDRERLTPEQIARRSETLQLNMDFYLLRFPDAMSAPGRIFSGEIWKTIELAADTYDLDPMLLAGMIFVESYGDRLAKSPTGPAGIAQLTKASAKELGLSTSRKTQVGWRTVTKTRTVGKGKNKKRIVEMKEEPVFQKVDERYLPDRAILAMAKRVALRRTWLGGKLDFAVAEYHMGAGRMVKLLSSYFGRRVTSKTVPALMQQSSLSYPDLFWTNTPYFRPAVYKQLEQLTRVDFSPTYYFRVRQAMRLLALYQRSPADYAALAAQYQGRFGRPVLPNWQWSFVREADVPQLALRDWKDLEAEFGNRIVALPARASQFGVRVRLTGESPIGETDLKNQARYIAAERSTIGCMLFVAAELERLQGKRFKGFETNSMVRHLGNQGLLVEQRNNRNAETSLPMHTFGWAFDIPRKRLSKDEVRDLNFILTDLRSAGLLAFVEEGRQLTFHVVRHPDYVEAFEQVYWDVVAVPSVERAADTR